MDKPRATVIKVMGLGGGGSNAVNRMIELGLDGIDFIAANTDAQALNLCLAPTRLQLGARLTHGQGAGGNPEIGAAAADESRSEIAAALAGADMVFLTAGMGGGTGTGAIAIAAEAARSVGALTVAVVTTPFAFEGTRRRRNAEAGLEKLQPHADTVITVPNDRLLSLVGRSFAFDVSLRVADEVLRQGVQGIAELISKPGLINVDFAHVRALMTGGAQGHDPKGRDPSGRAMLAIGQGRGEDKAVQAIRQALKMPLLDVGSVESARGLLVHFTGGDDLALHEAARAVDEITRTAPQAEVVFGVTMDPLMTGRAQVILVATGLDQRPALPPAPTAVPVRRAPEAAEVKSPEAHGHLAEALFSQAIGAAAPGEAPWIIADSQAPPSTGAQNLDVPAFLRRRRSLRDIERGQ